MTTVLPSLGRACAGLLACLALAACVLMPGKFTSELTVNADRSFTFRYVGEVLAQDPAGGMQMSDSSEGDAKAKAAAAAKKKADEDRKLKAVADQLRREAGFREAKYLGNGKFHIEYEISGTLTHSFVFPFNTDAELLIPFFAMELRKDGTVRIKAAGYTGSPPMPSGMPSMSGNGNSAIDGSFTVRTNAKVQMHNAEDAQTDTPARQVYKWTISPLTKDAPALTVKF